MTAWYAHHITRKGKAFRDWLSANGAQVLEPTNEWELIRFKSDTGTSVIYKDKGSDRTESVDDPLRTITGAHRGEKALATAYISPYYSDKRPADVRGHTPDEPIKTVPTENRHALVTAFLSEHANASGQRNMPADEPLRTICAQVKGGHFSMVSAHITKFRTGATGSAMDEPLHTITAGPKENPAGCPHAMGIVTAHIQRDMGQSVGHAADAPLGTITAGGGGKSALVASSLVKLRGTSSTAGVDEPLHTISAGGQHHAEVRAFLLKYYGTDQDPRLDEPLHTVTTKDRYGLVTIEGQDWEIVDIGLRMLMPRELYLAQGFPPHYVIGDGRGLPLTDSQIHAVRVFAAWLIGPDRHLKLTKSAQVRMCGNSVPPQFSCALARANFDHEREIARAA